MRLMKRGIRTHSRKSVACMVVLIMLLGMLGLGHPGMALAKVSESYPAASFVVNINNKSGKRNKPKQIALTETWRCQTG